jgi:hypothetical protein
MSMPKDTFHGEIESAVIVAWHEYVNGLEKSLDFLEEGINEAAEMADTCTSEWCVATEHVIDELANSLFSISEPKWTSDEDSNKLKALKRRVHDLYAKYKSTAG